MNKFIALLCFVSLAVLGSVSGNLKTPYSGLAKKIQHILHDNRDAFADGFKGLPPLDPISIAGTFNINGSPIKVQVSAVTVNGLSSFHGTSLDILSNGVFFGSVQVPSLTINGNISVPTSGSGYTGRLENTFSDVWIVISGLASVHNDQLSLSQIRTDITVDDIPTVKVTGLPGLLNDLIKQYLLSDLADLINNNSDIYEAALDTVVSDYLTTAVGTKYSAFVNKVNELSNNVYSTTPEYAAL